MSFPLSPLNGQLATVNNILYVYDSSQNTWTRVPGTTVLGGVSNTTGDLIWSTANSAGSFANGAFAIANGAYLQGNSTVSTVTTHTAYLNYLAPTTNAAFATANSAGNFANAAFAAANSGSSATSAFNQANLAYSQANSAASFANGAFTQANSTNTLAGAAANYANGAFTLANTTNTLATNAGNFANGAFTAANNALPKSGGSISGDLTVTGNLVIAGGATYVNTATYQTTDSLIELAANNTGDAVDIGFYGQVNSNTYTGLAKQAGTNNFLLFKGLSNPTTTGLPAGSATPANVATLIANVSAYSVTVSGIDTLGYSNVIFTQANNAGNFANGAFGVANGAASFANGAFTLANGHTTLISSVQSYANGAFTVANGASSFANGAFTTANNKTQTYYQGTAPSSPNTGDVWANNISGFAYENFGNTAYPVWVETGPSGPLSNISTLSAATLSVTTANVAVMNVVYLPASGVNSAIQIVAANTKGGTGYADFLTITNASGGATNPNKYLRLGISGTFEIINSAYTSTPFSMTDNGDLTISGNTTFNGIAPGYSPNRPGFRVIGGGTTNIDATSTQQTLTSSNWVVDWSQGSYLNGSTGVFTAPVAGLYSVNLTARTQLNNYAGMSAIGVVKTTGGTSTNVCYIEYYNNTTMNHTGSSSIVKLAAGDTLKLVATTGKITFDLNDNWSVAYLG